MQRDLIEFIFLGCLFLIKGQKLTLSSRNTNFVILNDRKAFLFGLNFLPLILIFLSLLHFGESSFGESVRSLNKDIYEMLFVTYINGKSYNSIGIDLNKEEKEELKAIVDGNNITAEQVIIKKKS